MKYIETNTYSELSEKGADLIAAQILLKPDCVLGLATGSSPIGIYKELIEKYRAGKLDFSSVTTVNLDEYSGLDTKHPQSYRYFMDNNLFDHINIDKSRTFVPDGTAEDIDGECAAYDARIKNLGGIDLQLLGIGENGHIGFNEPDEVFIKEVHKVQLKSSTIAANSRFFNDISEVPTSAITMGMGAIMAAKKILLIASGDKKRDIVKRAIEGPITPKVPASLLQLHPDVTVIFGKE